MSHLGPGWGVGPSGGAEEVGGGGGVVGGGEVSIGWAEGEGVEVVDEDEGGGGAAAEVVSVWEDDSLGRPWNQTQDSSHICHLTCSDFWGFFATGVSDRLNSHLHSLDDLIDVPQQVLS